MTDVDPELYYDTAAAYKGDSDGAGNALGTLGGALQTANAAGSHGVGPQWATAYDTTSDQAARVAQRMVNALHNIGNLLQQTGINHDQTEQASDLNRRDADGDPVTPVGETEGTYLAGTPDLPSAAGGTTPEPTGWHWVAEKVTDGWPNGNPDTLRAAGAAWQAFGLRLVEVNDAAGPEEINLLMNVDTAEIASVAAKMNTARSIGVDVAAAAGDLSRACTDYGNKLDQVQGFMRTTLMELNLLMVFGGLGRFGRLAKIINKFHIELAASHCNNLNEGLRTEATRTIKDLGVAQTSLAKALTSADTLLALTPRKVAPTPRERLAENRRKGMAAEQRSGIQSQQKTRIYPYANDQNATPKQREKYRIPDVLDPTTKTLTEIKNVQRLSATSQLRDMAKWAQENGYTMVIVTDVDRTQGADGVEQRLEERYPGLDVVIRPEALS